VNREHQNADGASDAGSAGTGGAGSNLRDVLRAFGENGDVLHGAHIRTIVDKCFSRKCDHDDIG
jgi:hypothetical protein